MQKKLKALAILTLSIGLFTLPCSPANAVPKPTICKMALTVGKDHAYAIAYQRLADLIQERTGGAIKVEMYYDGQLGTDRKVFEAVQVNGVQGTMVSTGTLSPFAKKLMVFDLPFVFPDRDVAFKVQESEIGEELLREINGTGVTALCFWESGYYYLTNNKEKITSLAGLKGIKVRALEATTHQETWKSLGMLPTVMPFSELFTALQQGVIDAQANTIPNIITSRVYEVQRYITVLPNFYHTMMVLFSDQFLDNISPEHRKIVEDAAREVRDWHKISNKEIVTKDIAFLEERGLSFTELAPGELGKIKEACAPVYASTAKNLGGDIVQRLQKKVEEFSK